MCKELIPPLVLVNQVETEILSLERPPEGIPYLILEKVENKNDVRGINLLWGKSIDNQITECSMV